MNYVEEIADEAASAMLAAYHEGASAKGVEVALERVITEHARTIGEAHMIRDRGWAKFKVLRATVPVEW